MNTSVLRRTLLAVGIVTPLVVGAGNASSSGERTGLMAKITLPSGAIRTARLEGVGCSISLCSRTAIKGGSATQPAQARFDQLAAITQTSNQDAVWVMQDGTRQRVALLKDFRVMYLISPSGAREKLDLANLKSIEFLPASK